MENLVYGIEIGSQTLVGVNTDKFPVSRGNCFDMLADDGNSYKIINFAVENLRFLIKQGMIELPVRLLVENDRCASIHDTRIQHNFYRDDICTVCAPVSLLNYTQQLTRARKLETGEIIERGSIVSVTPVENSYREYKCDGTPIKFWHEK